MRFTILAIWLPFYLYVVTDQKGGQVIVKLHVLLLTYENKICNSIQLNANQSRSVLSILSLGYILVSGMHMVDYKQAQNTIQAKWTGINLLCFYFSLWQFFFLTYYTQDFAQSFNILLNIRTHIMDSYSQTNYELAIQLCGYNIMLVNANFNKTKCTDCSIRVY